MKYTVADLLRDFGVDLDDDLTDEAKERMQSHLGKTVMIAHPNACKQTFPVANDQLCPVTGWEKHTVNGETVIAIRCSNESQKN